MSARIRFAVFLLGMLFATVGYAESFFDSSARGWHWYEKEPKEVPSIQLEKSQVIQDPNLRMEQLQQEVKKSLNLAILEPNNKNIINYIKLQEKLMNQSERFSQNWQKVLFTHPELDYSIKHPVNQSALHIYHAENQKNNEEKIKAMAKEYGLIFFYKGGCNYCKEFVPVVKDFAQRFNWEVLGITLDGIKLDGIRSQFDNGISKSLGITVVPSLIAIHPSTKEQIPVAYGFISQQEMEKRIMLLLEGK